MSVNEFDGFVKAADMTDDDFSLDDVPLFGPDDGADQEDTPAPNAGEPAGVDGEVINRGLRGLIEAMTERIAEVPEEDLRELLSEKSDRGFSKLLTLIAHDLIVYDEAAKEWYAWNGAWWARYGKGETLLSIFSDVVTHRLEQIAREKAGLIQDMELAIAKAGGKPTPYQEQDLEQWRTERAAVMKLIKTACSLHAVERAMKYSQGLGELGISGDEWDQSAGFLVFQNGVLDMATGKLVPPDPKKYMRVACPIRWNPNAKAPTWLKSTLQILGGDTELQTYDQRFYGYALSGTCTESPFLIFHGPDGRNGKEFQLEILKRVFGPGLVDAAKTELIMEKGRGQNASAATPDIMALQGKRLIWFSETNEGSALDLAQMKHFSGGWTMVGRHLYGGIVTFQRTATPILCTNPLPRIKGGGGGAEWDRLKVQPFLHSFVENPEPDNPFQHKKDPELAKKIISEELEGIAVWVVQGYQDYLKNGLPLPRAIKMATSAYQENEDLIGMFLEDKCVKLDPKIAVKNFASSTELYSEYKRWCEESGCYPLALKQFKTKLNGKKWKGTKIEERLSSGTVRYQPVGLKLQTEPEASPRYDSEATGQGS